MKNLKTPKTPNRRLAPLAALALAALLAGCGATAPAVATAERIAESTVETTVESTPATAENAAVTVTFTVTDKDGNATETALTATEGETLADALLAAGLISAEEHDAGYVTVVNDIATDYNADKSWWALVDATGEMTANGIGDITLADGDAYGFVYTVG